MEKSSDYKYYSFDSDNSILYHEVKDENFGDKESFIISLSYFITLIEKYKPQRIIIKIYKKPSYFELALKEFMQKTLYKSLLKVGIKKVAFYVSDEKYISELKVREKDDSIKFRFFLDFELAKQWVLN
jgi:hypothetical protein